MRWTIPLLILAVAACGGGPAVAPVAPTSGPAPRAGGAMVDPAALYCQGTGGTLVRRVAAGRRADLCRLPDGRTVAAADHLNSHNDL